MKKIVSVLISVVMCIGLLVGCGSSNGSSSDSSKSSDSEGKYKIAVSNAYMGNDWRQLMIKCLEVAATKEPYKNKVDLKVVNSENSAEAQASAIDALVEQGYDAILIDASSSAALLPAINRAIAQGITIVTFDSVVDGEGIYTVQTDFETMVEAWAKYLVTKCGTGANCS